MKKCFIVCPIGNDGSETRQRSDELLKYIIEPVCKECGFDAIRVDTINASDSINTTILDYLHTADLVIADLTEHNPNAFYELGYRFALNKPLIQLKHKSDTIPFDVSSIRTFDYDLNSVPSTEELKNRLIQTINSFDFNISTNTSEEPPKPSPSFDTQILQELFKIQDSIKLLSDKISSSKTDTAAVSVLADKLATVSTKSPETALMESFLNTLLTDPNKILPIMQIVNEFNDPK